jgi:hypothetical protein
MLIFHRQDARQYHGIKTANASFENVTKFKHFGKTVRNQNFIRKEMKSRLLVHSGNAYYHSQSVQNVSSSRFLYKKENSKFIPGLIN